MCPKIFYFLLTYLRTYLNYFFNFGENHWNMPWISLQKVLSSDDNINETLACDVIKVTEHKHKCKYCIIVCAYVFGTVCACNMFFNGILQNCNKHLAFSAEFTVIKPLHQLTSSIDWN